MESSHQTLSDWLDEAIDMEKSSEQIPAIGDLSDICLHDDLLDFDVDGRCKKCDNEPQDIESWSELGDLGSNQFGLRPLRSPEKYLMKATSCSRFSFTDDDSFTLSDSPFYMFDESLCTEETLPEILSKKSSPVPEPLPEIPSKKSSPIPAPLPEILSKKYSSIHKPSYIARIIHKKSLKKNKDPLECLFIIIKHLLKLKKSSFFDFTEKIIGKPLTFPLSAPVNLALIKTMKSKFEVHTSKCLDWRGDPCELFHTLVMIEHYRNNKTNYQTLKTLFKNQLTTYKGWNPLEDTIEEYILEWIDPTEIYDSVDECIKLEKESVSDTVKFLFNYKGKHSKKILRVIKEIFI